MKNFEIYEEMFDKKQYRMLQSEFVEENAADIAQLIENFPIDKAVLVFRILPKNKAADVFADLSSDVQMSITEKLSDKEISFIIEELFLDDAVSFIEEMPANIAKKVLLGAKPETREQINRLLNYPENSAGSIMTMEYVYLKKDMTVQDAFYKIRKNGVDKETIYTCYVIDSKHKLEGVVSVKTLLLAEQDEIVGNIMDDTNIITVKTFEDQEDVAHKVKKYDLLSIPVVDAENKMMGIITIDDIVDVIQEETTEDFEKMAAMAPSEKPYLKTSVFTHAKKRVAWLLFLMLAATVVGFIIEVYEDAIMKMAILVSFIPMLMGTGGNAGAQSSTLIIRGIAVSEIRPGDFLKVVWKELRVSLLVGGALALFNFVRIWLLYGGREGVESGIRLGAVVGGTLLFTVIIAKICGSMLPLLAKKCKIDPAVMAAPLITTMVDASALIVYFAIATALLGL